MTTPSPSTHNTAGGPQGGSAATHMVVSGTATSLERMRKMAEVRGSTIFSAEPPEVGGDGSAPRPLDYLAASILF